MKLNQLLTNDTYATKAKQLSKVFRDQPIHPMDNAMFHIEYVMRHNGAEYLKSAAVELSWYQHLLLDVLVVLLVALLFIVITIRLIVKSILRILCCGRDGGGNEVQRPGKLKAS